MSEQTTMPNLWPDTKASLSFLSRLPVRTDHDPRRSFTHTAHTFPFAGLLIGLVGGLFAAMAAYLGLPPLVCGIITLGALVVVTGALHEDGLADCADGFWGAVDREKRLAIMRDSRNGTYGTIALILSLVLRAALYASLIDALDAWGVLFLLAATSALSRAAMIWPWVRLPAARAGAQSGDKPGLSNSLGLPDEVTLRWTGLCSLPALAIIIALFGFFGAITAVLIAFVVVVVATRLARAKVGGHTGDVLGAVQQVTEIALLLAASVLI